MKNKQRFYVSMKTNNDDVTGSCYYLTVNYPDGKKERVLVDCGSEMKNGIQKPLFFDPRQIKACFITHTHADHICRLPELIKNGYEGYIYASNGTKLLMIINLRSGRKEMKIACKRKGIEPLYDSKAVEETFNRVIGHPYNERMKISENIEVTFIQNAHIIGSSMIYFVIRYEDKVIRILFGGDYNSTNRLFDSKEIPEEVLEKPVNLIQESTYGETDCRENTLCLKKVVKDTIYRKGTVVIPCLALRTEEVLYELNQIALEDEILKNVPIYIDGKTNFKYFLICRGHEEIFDYKVKGFPGNINFISVDKSYRNIAMNSSEPKIIISTSGMARGGQSANYITRYIEDPLSAIIFTCYQAEGTLGRTLRDQAYNEYVFINGVLRQKQARVYFTNEFSSHADNQGLIEFDRKFKKINSIFIGHGSKQARENSATLIKRNVRNIGDVVTFIAGYTYIIGEEGLINIKGKL